MCLSSMAVVDMRVMSGLELLSATIQVGMQNADSRVAQPALNLMQMTLLLLAAQTKDKFRA